MRRRRDELWSFNGGQLIEDIYGDGHLFGDGEGDGVIDDRRAVLTGMSLPIDPLSYFDEESTDEK